MCVKIIHQLIGNIFLKLVNTCNIVHFLRRVRFTDSHRCIGINVNDAMHRLKQVCIGYKMAFVSRLIVSNIFALVKTDLFIYNY